MSTPLRFVLRYDPVFLELGKRLGRGEWGGISGVKISAALNLPESERDLLAFLILLFGHPVAAERAEFPTFSRSILTYAGWTLTAECVIGKDIPTYGRGAVISGFLSCAAAIVEFRLGSERVLTAARDEERAYRVSMAEGDGQRYRLMDETSENGPVVARAGVDEAAVAAADRLVGYPG